MLMRGGVGAGPKPMADYIARDPRTGKPIEVATVVQRAQVEEGRRGAWSRLTPTQVLDLATGRSDVLDVMLDGGGNLLVSLSMQKPGLYVGSQSGLEFVMKLS